MMNCSQTQGKLPLLLYGDLDGSDALAIETHLAECNACQTALKELARVRELLDSVPAHDLRVDVGHLSAAVSPRKNQTSRPWKQYAFWAMPAVLLIALTFNLEVRFAKHQFIVRWGDVPQQEERETIVLRESEPVPPVSDAPGATQDLDERIRVLDELVHALADQVNAHDREQRDRLSALQTRLGSLEQVSREYRDQANRSVAALYAACFPNTSQGKVQ